VIGAQENWIFGRKWHVLEYLGLDGLEGWDYYYDTHGGSRFMIYASRMRTWGLLDKIGWLRQV
jgi:hypothetical protein